MLQSMGSKRVGHDWATEQQQHCSRVRCLRFASCLSLPTCCDLKKYCPLSGLCSPSSKYLNILFHSMNWGFPAGSVVKNLSANVGVMGSIPGLGRSYIPRSN